MAAVLAVAVLLLCSSARSEEVLGTVTQVEVSDLPTLPNDTAPVITNPTEGSSDTHSAVLANQELKEEDHGPLVLVDLARADNQHMSNMPPALPPPAPVMLLNDTSVDGSDTVLAADTVPEGFDLNEFDNSTAQATLTPEGSDTTVLAADTTTVPEGFDFNEFENSTDSTAQATLIPDGQDGTVLAADTTTVPEGFDFNEFDEGSNSTDTIAQANQEDAPLSLAADIDTTPVPKGFDFNEFDEPGSDSLAVANQDDEPLVLAADTRPVPKGFDLNEFDDEGSSSSSSEFYDEPESLAATQDDEGTLVPGFPTIGSSQEYTHGQGYGVHSYDAGSAGSDDSFAAYRGDSASFADQGTLDEGYPEIGSSQGQGYGDQTYGGEEDNSFTAYNYADPSFADQGTLVQGYPGIGDSQDNSQGPGFGVRPYGPFYGRP